MIFEIIIALIIGLLIGIITGLTPGIHINLVAIFLLEISAFLQIYFPPIALAIFIASLSITHLFIDFIPTIFLGAPDENTSLSILPGHEMLLSGNGHEAVVLSLLGSFIGIILFIFLIPIFILILPLIYEYIQNIIPLILILIILIMILFEKNKLLLTILIISLSGFLGYASLNLNLTDPLLPLLTGLFGSSSLITSIAKKSILPKQNIITLKSILQKTGYFSIIKSISASLIAAPICSTIPALGSNQASTIGSLVIGKINKREFLILIGIVNSLVMSLSFVILYSISKSRTGSAVAISKLIAVLAVSDIIIIIISIIISGIIAFIISIKLSKHFSRLINRIDYNKLSLVILIFLTVIIILFSGVLGLLIFITSTALGISCILLGVKRTSLMSCLIIPTIILYIF